MRTELRTLDSTFRKDSGETVEINDTLKWRTVRDYNVLQVIGSFAIFLDAAHYMTPPTLFDRVKDKNS